MKFKKPGYPIYRVIVDGGISVPGLAEGRFIPSLIINADFSSEVADLIAYHQDTPAGDATQQWGRPMSFFSTKYVILEVQFTQPMKISFGIQFEVKKQYSLVDGIIQSRAFYLQVGKPGDKISDLKKDKILIESPDTGFDQKWGEILLETLKSKYKGKSSKKEAAMLAKAHIKSMREMWNSRRDK